MTYVLQLSENCHVSLFVLTKQTSPNPHCPKCNSNHTVKHGFTKGRTKRNYSCKTCHAWFHKPTGANTQ